MDWSNPESVKLYKHAWQVRNRERLRALKREYYLNHKSHILKKNKDNKVKRLERLGKDAINAKERLYRSKDPQRFREHRKRWFINHPDKAKAYWKRKSKRYRNKNKTRLNTKAKENYWKNRDAVLKRMKESYRPTEEKKNYLKEWYGKNPHKISQYSLKRRALINKASINLSVIELFVKEVKDFEYCFCYYCGSKILSKSCHFDHIVPVSKGGHHSVDNLCTSCATCNRKKGARLVAEWKDSPKILIFDL